LDADPVAAAILKLMEQRAEAGGKDHAENCSNTWKHLLTIESRNPALGRTRLEVYLADSGGLPRFFEKPAFRSHLSQKERRA
jgi:hypothetical protein